MLATAKHWIGDGGTFHGDDQGETRTSAKPISDRTHAAGYYGALAADVQTVMVSYSSFTDTATGKRWGKMHGNAHLIGDVLKQRIGFDGLVVSDWNGIEQVPGCTKWHCPQAINAGIDMIMVPDDWKQFIAATIDDVKAGRIPMSRIDDAVSRIIRVKLKSGLFDASPATGPRPDASVMSSPGCARARPRGGAQVAGAAEERSRRAAAQARGQDPRRRQGRGQPADAGRRLVADLAGRQHQDVGLSERRHLACRRCARTLGADRVDYSADGAGVDVSRYSAVVMVAAEKPYAEMQGRHHLPGAAAPLARAIPPTCRRSIA